MTTITCTRCGLRGSDGDAFCTRCGMSRTGNSVHGSGSGSGSQVAKWIAIAAVCGFGGIVVIGILAAIAIPKFANVSRAAKEAEAAPILAHLLTLEAGFRDGNGRYTANLSDPSAADYLAGAGDVEARYYTFSVSRATDDELCIEAEPSQEGAAARVSPASMDAAGAQYTGPGCINAPVNALPEIVGSEAGPTLREIHALQTEFHERHGRFTANLADSAEPDHLGGWNGEVLPYFTFVVTWATADEFCVEAHPTMEGHRVGVVSSSMDEAGDQYLGLGCTGTRMTSSGPATGGTGSRSEAESESDTVVRSEAVAP